MSSADATIELRVCLESLCRLLTDRTLAGNFVIILVESDFYDDDWDIEVEPETTRRAMFAAPALDVGFVRERLREIDLLERRSFENTDDLAIIGTELADVSPWLEGQLAYRTRSYALLTYLASHAAEPSTRAYVKRRLVFF